jgi:glutamate 5-kinase
VLRRIFEGEPLGTCLESRQKPWAARKQWLAGLLTASGRLTLDDGAVNVLHQHGRSLLPVGVTAVQGEFERGAVVECIDQNGRIVARGLINFGSEDAQKIVRKNSEQLVSVLGYEGDHEMIHRDNLVVLS